jgi:hypothetical protein
MMVVQAAGHQRVASLLAVEGEEVMVAHPLL